MLKTKVYCSLSVNAVKLRGEAPSPQGGEGWGEVNRIRKKAFKIPLSLGLSATAPALLYLPTSM